MALSVLNNIASLAAQNQLTITNANLQKALFQLSSGSRINSGADDAAGLAIADGLQGNITALTQSARNANDGVGELQVADGSLAQVTTLLNRAVTLATESATGTVSNPQRVALDAEYTAIKSEIDRIGSKTNYNAGQVFTANTLNVFLSDSGASSNSLIGVTTGTLSSSGLSLGGAVAATGTLSQKAGSAAVAATDIMTGPSVANFFAVATKSTNAVAVTGTSGTVAGDSLTINGTTYTFAAANANGTFSGGANTVAVGSTELASLQNLAAAVNGTAGGAGTAYGVGTVANTSVTAGTATATSPVLGGLTFTAKANGTAAIAITAGSDGAGGNAVYTPTSVTGAAGDSVTVGGQKYTFVTSLSGNPTANEVVGLGSVPGRTADLANLVAAINGSAGSGTTYSSSTPVNPLVTAAVTTPGTTVTFTAINPGSAGNYYTASSSNTGTNLATFTNSGTFGGAGNTNGADAGAAPVAAAGDSVLVGTQTYNFVSNFNIAPTANQIEVLVGSTEAASLANLANAVNGTAGSGLNYAYGSSATANTSAKATAGATSVTFTALTPGVAGNGVATAASGTANTFANPDLTGGASGSTNDLLSQADATAALATINSAVQSVAALRGAIGATVNRLQSAATVITNQVQNLTGAEDGVRAADIPSTVAQLAKYSILEQTGISALAQANQQQQLVLKLLQ